MRRVLVLVAALVALACCTPESPPNIAISNSDKSIAIIAAIPPQIRLATTGLTVFDNSLDVADVPEWHLDSVARDAAVHALSPRYRIAYAMTDSEFADPESRLEVALDDTTTIQTYARSHARADSPVDLFVVLCLSARAFPYTDYPDVFQFIGVSKLRDPILTRAPVVHSYVLATILDGRTFKIITETPLFLPPHKRTSWMAWGVGGNYPEEQLQDFQWKDLWRNLTTDQKNLIRDRITYLLSTSIYYTLQTTLVAGGS